MPRGRWLKAHREKVVAHLEGRVHKPTDTVMAGTPDTGRARSASSPRAFREDMYPHTRIWGFEPPDLQENVSVE